MTYILFWPHNDMNDLPGWGVTSMPVPPPRQHEHERRYTSFTHPFIRKRRIWKDGYDLVGLKLPDICLTGEEELWKTLPMKIVPTGHETRARCMRGAHAAICSRAVDRTKFLSWSIVIDVKMFSFIGDQFRLVIWAILHTLAIYQEYSWHKFPNRICQLYPG